MGVHSIYLFKKNIYDLDTPSLENNSNKEPIELSGEVDCEDFSLRIRSHSSSEKKGTLYIRTLSLHYPRMFQ